MTKFMGIPKSDLRKMDYLASKEDTVQDRLVASMVEKLQSLLGNAEYIGDKPFETSIVDNKDRLHPKGYKLEIRRGTRGFTIRILFSDMPTVRKFYNITQENGRWKFYDMSSYDCNVMTINSMDINQKLQEIINFLNLIPPNQPEQISNNKLIK